MVKQGNICLIGKPNVGKSTLINNLLNYKLAITSPKPQTTRQSIKGIYNDNNYNILIIDTPGYHNARNKLDELMNYEVKKNLTISDCIFFLFDPTRPYDEEDDKILKLLKNIDLKNVILVITKIDSNAKKNEYIEEVKTKFNFVSTISISSVKKEGLKELIDTAKPFLHDSDTLYKIEDDDNFIISELIREQIIFNTKKEVPYSTYVKIEKKSLDGNLFNIFANIIVEKESQKPIIIGKGGSMIKKIGTYARKELLNIYDCKINLKLFVKVDEKWREKVKTLNIY